MEYGKDNNSKIIWQENPSVHAWELSKITDSTGNTITFQYSGGAVDGEYYATQIDYSNNTKMEGASKNSIYLEYEQRPDVSTKYAAGGFVKSSHRLKRIYSYAGTKQVFEHRLAYASGLISRIESITECDADVHCKPPIRFVWFENSTGLPKVVNGTKVVAPDNWRDTYAV